VIEDIEGATSEPTRRLHVVVLSGAVAIASLVLLLALVVPAPVSTLPLAAAPAPTASAGTVVNFAPNPISQMRVDLSRTTVCSDGTRLSPPYFLMMEGTTRVISVAQFDARTGEQTRSPVPVAFRFDASSGWMTITCATDDRPVPWESVSH
jgi:hypothetical protein